MPKPKKNPNADLTFDELMAQVRTYYRARVRIQKAKHKEENQRRAAVQSLLATRDPAKYEKHWETDDKGRRTNKKLNEEAQKILKRFDDLMKPNSGQDVLLQFDFDVPTGLVLLSLSDAIQRHDRTIAELDKELGSMGVLLPAYDSYVKGVCGFGALTFALIVGESGDISRYPTVSTFWKRMGVACHGRTAQGYHFNGQGKYKRIDGEAAVEERYSPSRRSVVWKMATFVKRLQIGSEEIDGKVRKLSKGPEGQMFLDRYDYEISKGCTHAHAQNRAWRYVSKHILKNLWLAWHAETKSEQKTKPYMSTGQALSDAPTLMAAE